MKRNIARATLVIFSVAAIWGAEAIPAVAQSFPGIGTVMTYNVNEGTDFLQVVSTTTLPQFLDVYKRQVLTDVINCADIGMIQGRSRLSLALKAA